MITSLFGGLFDTAATQVLSPAAFLLCVGTALLSGLLLALLYLRSSHSTRGFVTTLAVLPAVVCVVIMMVNGNLGIGVAVTGAFNLVRFRSVPGTAREISAIFLAMGAGLIAGMGYLAYCLLFTLLLGGVSTVYGLIHLGARGRLLHKTLHITIPEQLDYNGVFEDLFQTYARQWELCQVKTTNMGSLYRLTYHLTLRQSGKEKEFLDALRCRNGNLEISLSYQENNVTQM